MGNYSIIFSVWQLDEFEQGKDYIEKVRERET